MNQDPVQALAQKIDHTLLKPEASRRQIVQLCEEAVSFGFGAVCVNPLWVGEAAQVLAGTSVRVATVVGFPLGATPTSCKVFEAERALGQGAQELDMVASLGLVKSGELNQAQEDIAQVAKTAHACGAVLKVILETHLLTDEEKACLAEAAVAAGANFLKTSTGFLGGGATIEDVALLRRLAPPSVGVKASGGIRSFVQARAMLAAGANRLGTSSGVAIVQEARAWYASK